jgi:ER lumen protein retaining receptor
VHNTWALLTLAPHRQVENLTSHYVFALGSYRGLYLLNWIYRYFTEDDYQQRIVWISGIVQVSSAPRLGRNVEPVVHFSGV